MTLPASAQDFLSNIFGGSGARQERHSLYGRRHALRHQGRGGNEAWRAAMPEGARSFVAKASFYGGGPRGV
jgi:hypothetical protein